MRKCLLLLAFVPSLLSAQTNAAFDSLKKYSYPVLSLNASGVPIGSGSGFFVRDQMGAPLFFTCGHVAYDQGVTRLSVIFPDGYIVTIIPSQFRKDTIADLAVFPVKDLGSKPFSDVSKLIETSFYYKKPNQIIVWGYPDPIRILEQVNFIAHLIIAKQVNDSAIIAKWLNYDGKKVNLHEALRLDKLKNIWISEPLQHGTSGAPTFGIFTINGKQRARFIGMIYKSSMSGQGIALNAEYIFDHLISLNR